MRLIRIVYHIGPHKDQVTFTYEYSTVQEALDRFKKENPHEKEYVMYVFE